MELKFIDLFAGMGGFRIGFEEAARELGYTPHCVFSSEIKPYAINVYQHNFAEKTIHGDITQIDENTIPDFDVLLAGFPCQAFSSAGKSLGFEDTRGTLFFDVARVLKAKQPKGFILENVEGLVRHDNGNTLKVILQTLFDLGYTTNWKLLDSKYHGLAQSRQRIYIVGTKNGTAVDLNFEKSEPVRLQDILEEGIPSTKSVFTKQLLKHYPIQS